MAAKKVVLLEQDDCAPDALESFDKELYKRYGIKRSDFRERGEKTEDGYRLGGLYLEMYPDSPYWCLFHYEDQGDKEPEMGREAGEFKDGDFVRFKTGSGLSELLYYAKKEGIDIPFDLPEKDKVALMWERGRLRYKSEEELSDAEAYFDIREMTKALFIKKCRRYGKSCESQDGEPELIGTVTESLYQDGSMVVPLALVQHVEVLDKHNPAPGDDKRIPDGLFVITSQTRRDESSGRWLNAVKIPEENKDRFINAWRRYRFEVEGGESVFVGAEGGKKEMWVPYIPKIERMQVYEEIDEKDFVSAGWIAVRDVPPPTDRAFYALLAGANIDICWFDHERRCFVDYYHKQEIHGMFGWKPLVVPGRNLPDFVDI